MLAEICTIGSVYSLSGQVTPEYLSQAAQLGFRSVLNLRDPKESGFWAGEAAQAEALGLVYAQVALSPRVPERAPLENALLTLENLPKPVLIHCRTGARATALAMVAIATQEALTLEQFIWRVAEYGLDQKQPQIQQFLQDHYDQPLHRPFSAC